MSIRWAEPPQQLRLAPNEVHVWRAELQMEDSELARLSASLSPDEQHRATRYRSSADARLFLLARGVLRHILSSYLDATAAELSFRYSAHGKPSLANPGADWLHFNVSHSGTLALVALARDSEIGVDVEQIRPELATWQLATAFFA
jgi:4'-phosphopantetheinyl transferase